MSRYFAAFDVAVSAAGYNAFHELIALGVPSLYVPMHRQTDDQAARARWAEQARVGRGAESANDPRLLDLLDQLLEPDARAGIAARFTELDPATGATEAAAWLTGLAARRDEGRVGTSPRSRTSGPEVAGDVPARPPRSVLPVSRQTRAAEFRRRWRQFLRYAPRTAVRLTRQQLTQPRPRTLLFALGIKGDVVGAVRAALTETPDPPERVLVVTDSLALVPLRELGVGVEHVPGPGDRQPELARGDYESFLRARLELILAERPRPKRVLTAPGCRPPPSRVAG